MVFMKLLFKQRLFSWFDSYDIYDENEQTFFTVKGQLSWGHCLKIFDSHGTELGTVKQRFFAFLPKFDLYLGNECVGCIEKDFTLFRPRFDIDFCGWHVEGDFFEWDYTVLSSDDRVVAVISKELFHLTDTYVLQIEDPSDALRVLMLVLAIDAEKCSRN